LVLTIGIILHQQLTGQEVDTIDFFHPSTKHILMKCDFDTTRARFSLDLKQHTKEFSTGLCVLELGLKQSTNDSIHLTSHLRRHRNIS
jgi:hypothetical protein